MVRLTSQSRQRIFGSFRAISQSGWNGVIPFFFVVSLLFPPGVSAQEEPCEEPALLLPYEIERTWPQPGGVLPADEPILIELVASPMAPDSPEQPIENIDYKEVFIGPLPLGVVHGIQTLRSDYGTTRYLPAPNFAWEPTAWNVPLKRKMLLIIRFYALLDDGTVAPQFLTEGMSYTLSMKVADLDGPLGTYKETSFTFTAGPPVGDADIDFATDPEASLLTESSCDNVELGCASEPPLCEVICDQSGGLHRTDHQINLDHPIFATTRSLATRFILSTHPYEWIAVRFPGEPATPSFASLSTFHGLGSAPDSVCAEVRAGSPGLDPIITLEACADIGSAPDCDPPPVFIADENPEEDIAPPPGPDAGSTEDVTERSVPRLLDTHLSGGDPTDGDAKKGDAPLDASNEDTGSNSSYNSPSYDGCSCHTSQEDPMRWRLDLLFIMLLLSGLVVLRRRLA